MTAFLIALSVGLFALCGFFAWVSRDMNRGLREMQRRTREVEALLDHDTRRS